MVDTLIDSTKPGLVNTRDKFVKLAFLTDHDILIQFRWCDFVSRERFDLSRAPDPSRPPPGRRRNILKRQAS